jgi:hypothetical protein
MIIRLGKVSSPKRPPETGGEQQDSAMLVLVLRSPLLANLGKQGEARGVTASKLGYNSRPHQLSTGVRQLGAPSSLEEE